MKKIMIATLALTLFAGVAGAQTKPKTVNKPVTPTATSKPVAKKTTSTASSTANAATKPSMKDSTGHTAMMRKHAIHKKTKQVPKAGAE